MQDPVNRPNGIFRVVRFFLSVGFSLALFAALLVWLLVKPDSPLPNQWNPTRALDVRAPVTPVTRIQLVAASRDGAMCRRVLARAGAEFSTLDDLIDGDNCSIKQRGALHSLVDASVSSVETKCATALRLAMWEHHVVQPAAKAHFGTGVASLRHVGSYNCRKMRTSRGTNEAWSSHATADAFDITGVTLSDGRRLTLLKNWNGTGREQRFFREIWQGSCRWFRLVLGPEYNRLHADHFHLQATGWSICR